MAKLPKRINLSAMKTQWKISYIESPGELIILERPRKVLILYGKGYSKLAAKRRMARWVKIKAEEFLILLTKQLNRSVKARYKKLIIRSQDSRWGSCSNTKTISLNYKLIFLPLPLVKYLILHELCHVRHWNHSEKFWDELNKFDSNYIRHDELINDADRYLPDWLVM